MLKWYEFDSQFPSTKGWKAILDLTFELKPIRWHFFFYEPWSPFILRVQGEFGLADLERFQMKPAGTWREIDMTADEELYGVYFPLVMNLYSAMSAVSLAKLVNGDRTTLTIEKLVHCLLNTWGFGRIEETKYHMNQAVMAETFHVLEEVLELGEEDLAKASLALRKWGA